MAIPIKRTDKTLIFDLRDFAPLGEEAFYLLCLNENTYHVILNLFQFYGFWLNRYTPSQNDEVWYQPEGEEAEFVRDMYDKGMEELQMPVCFDELNERIDNLIAAIQGLTLTCNPQITVEATDLSGIIEALNNMNITNNVKPTINVNCGSSCCGGNSGGGNGENLPNDGGGIVGDPGYGDAPPYTLPGDGTPPSGFPDPPTYDTYKCKAANVLVLWLAEMLWGLGDLPNYPEIFGWTFAAASDFIFQKYLDFLRAAYGTVEELLIGGTTFTNLYVRWIANTVAAAALDDSALAKVALEQMRQLRLVMLSNRDDAVCAFYSAQDTDEARTNITTLLEGYIDNLVISETAKAKMKLIISGLLPNLQANILFEKSQDVANYSDPSAVECDICTYSFWDDCGQQLFRGVDQITVSSGYHCGVTSDCHAVFVLFDYNSGGRLPNPRQFKVEIINGGPSGSVCCTLSPYAYYDINNDPIGGGRSTPDSNQCCNAIHFFDTQPFTVTLKFTLCE